MCWGDDYVVKSVEADFRDGVVHISWVLDVDIFDLRPPTEARLEQVGKGVYQYQLVPRPSDRVPRTVIAIWSCRYERFTSKFSVPRHGPQSQTRILLGPHYGDNPHPEYDEGQCVVVDWESRTISTGLHPFKVTETVRRPYRPREYTVSQAYPVVVTRIDRPFLEGVGPTVRGRVRIDNVGRRAGSQALTLDVVLEDAIKAQFQFLVSEGKFRGGFVAMGADSARIPTQTFPVSVDTLKEVDGVGYPDLEIRVGDHNLRFHHNVYYDRFELNPAYDAIHTDSTGYRQYLAENVYTTEVADGEEFRRLYYQERNVPKARQYVSEKRIDPESGLERKAFVYETDLMVKTRGSIPYLDPPPAPARTRTRAPKR